MKVYISTQEWFPVLEIETEEDLLPEKIEDFADIGPIIDLPKNSVKKIKDVFKKFAEIQKFLAHKSGKEYNREFDQFLDENSSDE